MSNVDQRKSERRPLRYRAWLRLDPNKTLDCVLSDVSETGGCIEVEDSRLVPDRFFLLLSMNGAARRICRVMWRKPQQLGVKFARSFAEAEKPAAAPEAAPEQPPETTNEPGQTPEPAAAS